MYCAFLLDVAHNQVMHLCPVCCQWPALQPDAICCRVWPAFWLQWLPVLGCTATLDVSWQRACSLMVPTRRGSTRTLQVSTLHSQPSRKACWISLVHRLKQVSLTLTDRSSGLESCRMARAICFMRLCGQLPQPTCTRSARCKVPTAWHLSEPPRWQSRSARGEHQPDYQVKHSQQSNSWT